MDLYGDHWEEAGRAAAFNLSRTRTGHREDVKHLGRSRERMVCDVWDGGRCVERSGDWKREERASGVDEDSDSSRVRRERLVADM